MDTGNDTQEWLQTQCQRVPLCPRMAPRPHETHSGLSLQSTGGLWRAPQLAVSEAHELMQIYQGYSNPLPERHGPITCLFLFHSPKAYLPSPPTKKNTQKACSHTTKPQVKALPQIQTRLPNTPQSPHRAGLHRREELRTLQIGGSLEVSQGQSVRLEGSGSADVSPGGALTSPKVLRAWGDTLLYFAAPQHSTCLQVAWMLGGAWALGGIWMGGGGLCSYIPGFKSKAEARLARKPRAGP